ncbi:glycosyltransferase family 2 protein [Maribellus sediminis]|uniref:glycosyltransferase family 2 protein n=1 Tax=Maribellus sediminis TaxID=2696285 RepID=UPI00142F6A41|nr:glycosyltransferase family A protein [Maribellus sediminis]
MKTNIVLHHSKSAGYSQEDWVKTLQSVFVQTGKDFEITILHDSDSDISAEIEALNTSAVAITVLKLQDEPQSVQLQKAFENSNADGHLYIDNRTQQVVLKKSALELLGLTVKNNNNVGMIYGDYEMLENNEVKEIRLLKHHIGRVRDNQDYGKVFFFTAEALKNSEPVSADVQFNAIYDLRLKISEKFKLLHIANRYAGSLYQVVAQSKAHNVFDYLLASKDSQLEAENILSGHLKRIGAYLEAGAHYTERPKAGSEATLKASVIIPVNNRPEFICDAIESVQAQTVKEVEVIVVVNGGENDPTVESVKAYQPGGEKYDAAKPEVRLLIHDMNNLGLCFNSGARIARGEYYVQLDSDDRLTPDAVEKVLAVYNSDPKIGMVIGSYEVWEKDASGAITRMEQIPVVTHDEWTEENGRNNLLRINGAGAPRSIPIELIKEIGFSMNEEPFARNYGEDYQMVMKISERHRIGRVWDPIYKVIRHAGGTDHSIDQNTIDRNDEAKDFMRKESIQRRIKLNK